MVVPGCLVQAAGRLRASEGRALHREAKDPDYLAPPCVNSRVTLSTPQSSPSPCFLSYETGERLGELSSEKSWVPKKNITSPSLTGDFSLT